MLGLAQGDEEGRLDSSFANVPASFCQPFTITMSPLSHLSAKSLCCISTCHVFKNFSTLPSGAWQLSWMNLLHLFLMPAGRELEEGFRASSSKSSWSHICCRGGGRMELGAAVLLARWRLTFQIFCIKTLGLAECVGNVLIWKRLFGLIKTRPVFLKMGLGRMVAQASASLCKGGIRKLAHQGDLAAQRHFGHKPIDPMFCVHFMENLPPGSATGLVIQMEHFLLGAGPCTAGQRRPFGGHLPVQSLPFRFNHSSSFFPSYSFPWWLQPTLIFSFSEFQSCYLEAGGRMGSASLPAVLLINVM